VSNKPHDALYLSIANSQIDSMLKMFGSSEEIVGGLRLWQLAK
jgi:hypothetical protein